MSGVAPATPPELWAAASSRLLGGARPGRLVALLSTLVVFGVIGYVVVTSPGWPRVQQSFFSAEIFNASFPEIVRGALEEHPALRAGRGLHPRLRARAGGDAQPARAGLLPAPALAIVYIDIFRGLPSILVIYVIGLGIPACGCRA